MSTPRTLSVFWISVALILPGCGKGLSGLYLRCSPGISSSERSELSFGSGRTVSIKVDTYVTGDCGGTGSNRLDSSGTFVETASDVPQGTGLNLVFDSGSLKGKTQFQIYKSDGDKLYLGDTSGSQDASSEARRPVAFDVIPYVKQ